MTHTFTLKWRSGFANWFINRFLKKFEKARDRCKDSITAVDAKIAELKRLKMEFSDQVDFVNNFLPRLKR